MYIAKRTTLRVAIAVGVLAGGLAPTGLPAASAAEVALATEREPVHYMIDAGARRTRHPWMPERSGKVRPHIRGGSRLSFKRAGVASSSIGLPARLFRTAVVGQSRSRASMRWTFPVTPGDYDVRLHFAEAARRPKRPGGRVFDVVVEGRIALKGYDIAAKAGAKRSISESIRTRSDAVLEIVFVARRSRPLVSALEIVESQEGTIASSAAEECPDQLLEPSMDVSRVVAQSPPGTGFCFAPGVYSLSSPIKPRTGQAFVGQPGATLSGAVEMDGWQREGDLWKVTGQTQESRPHGNCVSGEACRYNEDLYVDNTLLRRVMNLEEVEPGSYFFDYAGDTIYIGDDPSGHRFELASTSFAFLGSTTVSDVLVQGLTVEKFANPAQKGAIFPNGGERWTVSHNEIRLNHGTGLSAFSGGALVANFAHHNGQKGLGAMGSNVLVEGNEIAYNNTVGFRPGWEAGGTKFAVTTNLVVRDNYVHHNEGPGLWTDIDNLNTVYEGNFVSDNAGEGIFHEISYDAVIKNNVVLRNGFGDGRWFYGAGILVAHSSNVEVYRNVVQNNFHAIAGIDQERGEGRYGPYVLRNMYVHHNVVRMPVGQTGIAGGPTDGSIFTRYGNRFEHNRYLLGTGRAFSWLRAAHDPAGWRRFGNDRKGRFRQF